MNSPAHKPTRRRRVLKGLPVSPGIAIGKTHLLDFRVMNYPSYWISEREVVAETKRLKKAMQDCQQQLLKVQQGLSKFQVGEKARILDTYQMIVKDPLFIDAISTTIKEELINSEWAVMKAVERFRSAFSHTDVTHFLERRNDLEHVAHRILKQLVGQGEITILEFKKDSIVIAPDLSPADTAQMVKGTVAGFVTEGGGTTSHTAIMARALEIPAIVGIDGLISIVPDGIRCIVDGDAGTVIVNPTGTDTKKYQIIRKQAERLKKTLLKDIDLPSVTQDDYPLRLVANMELIEEIPTIKTYGAEGIGLYRSETLYLRKQRFPSEEEQYQHYKKILAKMKPQAVTIRTLDIGGEKALPGTQYLDEVNPALGLRSIRYCLHERELFSDQLRALLRASPYGALRIMFPMITSLEEIRECKELLAELTQELQKKKVRISEGIKLGAMIETPASAVLADVLAAEVDFLSIGTNDLIQYTLAVDRANEHVADLYDPYHPAILRLLKQIVDAAKSRNVWVSLCGEIAGEADFFPLLLGLGIHELSMNPLSIPQVKKRLRELTFHEANQLVERALQCKTADDVKGLLAKHK